MLNKGLVISVLLLIGICYLSVVVYQTETEKQQIKEDLIELSKIKYGLFSVDEWKNVLAVIITRKIEEFDLEGASREKMRVEIESFLYQQINDLEVRYKEENSRSFFGALIQNPIASVTGIFEKIKKDIPIFTAGILDFLNDPKNRDAIRGYIINKLDEYADKTFSETDYTKHDKIISGYGFKNRVEALSGLELKVDELRDQNRPYQIGLIVLAILTALFISFSKIIDKSGFLILTAICFMYLLGGLLLPMIEIDARIARMNFNLLGEPVTFQDQVLYYESKSILEVVGIMMTQFRVDLIFVGLLVLAFSVLFPVTKLISSIMFLNDRGLVSNKFMNFMIFKSGKWSMADVMVIAIFMAYIGFSGIITEQLKQIENITPNMDILTTNKSSLLIGFFAFTSFAILSLLTSHKLQYGYREQKNDLTNEIL